MTKPTRFTLFYSYSHKDENMRDDLATHLAPLVRRGMISEWYDRRISPGTSFDDAISANLDASDIVLLLISSDFMASDYCYSKELTRAIERHDAGTARVIPIILRACNWNVTPIGRLQALPKDAIPVRKWDDPDEAYLSVSLGIERAIADITAARQRRSTIPDRPPTSRVPDSRAPASSTLSDGQARALIGSLVNTALNSLSSPYSEDVVEDVFVAIENRFDLLTQYQAIVLVIGAASLNQSIGRMVRDELHATAIKQVAANRSTLVGSYSKLLIPTSSSSAVTMFVDGHLIDQAQKLLDRIIRAALVELNCQSGDDFKVAFDLVSSHAVDPRLQPTLVSSDRRFLSHPDKGQIGNLASWPAVSGHDIYDVVFASKEGKVEWIDYVVKTPNGLTVNKQPPAQIGNGVWERHSVALYDTLPNGWKVVIETHQLASQR